MHTMTDKVRVNARRNWMIACLLAELLLIAAPGLRGQSPSKETSVAPQKQQSVAVTESGGSAPITLHLLVGRSRVISTVERVTRVSVADPNIVDVMVVGSKQVLVNGKTPGGVSVVLWDASGQSESYEVTVDLDTQSLTDQLRAAFPGQTVQVASENDAVVLSGHVSSQAIADKMLDIAKAVWPKTVSMLDVPGVAAAEVLLQVKFAEVNREAVSNLGLNILSLPGAKNVGTISTQQFSGPQIGAPVGATGSSGSSTGTGGFSLSNLLNIFYFRPDINLALTIQALQEQNLLQILAEPDVLTQSGKDASFLSGGQFPYPVVQNSGTGVPVVTILFKEFGIKLDFTPTVTTDGIIHLKVLPEVSSLDYTNALTLQGFVIPALSVNRVEAEMDLRDGQSFAIAGLVDDQVTNNLEKIPGLGNIPLFGKLFQSRSLTKSKNELLIMVTPHIVKPLPAENQSPLPVFPQPFLPPVPAKPAKSSGK